MDKVYKDPKHIFRLDKLGCIRDRLFCWKSESLNWLCECVYVGVHYAAFSVHSIWLLMKRSSQSGHYRWNELLPLTTTSSSFYIQGVLIWLFADADLKTGIWLVSTLWVVSRMMCLVIDVKRKEVKISQCISE